MNEPIYLIIWSMVVLTGKRLDGDWLLLVSWSVRAAHHLCVSAGHQDALIPGLHHGRLPDSVHCEHTRMHTLLWCHHGNHSDTLSSLNVPVTAVSVTGQRLPSLTSVMLSNNWLLLLMDQLTSECDSSSETSAKCVLLKNSSLKWYLQN